MTGATTLDSTLAVAGDANFDSGTLFVDVSSNNVGIGTTSPSTGFNANRNNLVISDASAVGLTLNSTATDGSSIISMTDGTGTLAGEIHYVHDGDYMQFKTATAERMRIDSSGNVIQEATHIIKNAIGDSSGLKLSQESSDESRIFNHFSGAMTFGTANTERMRILAGGGLTFCGDTAAANALDDYEEGSWTPSASTSAANSTINTTVNFAKYIKVGGLVHASCYLSLDIDAVGTGAAIINGLPFTATSGQGYNLGIVAHATAVVASGTHGISAYVTNGQTHVRMVGVTDAANPAWVAGDPKYIMIDVTYHHV